MAGQKPSEFVRKVVAVVAQEVVVAGSVAALAQSDQERVGNLLGEGGCAKLDHPVWVACWRASRTRGVNAVAIVVLRVTNHDASVPDTLDLGAMG